MTSCLDILYRTSRVSVCLRVSWWVSESLAKQNRATQTMSNYNFEVTLWIIAKLLVAFSSFIMSVLLTVYCTFCRQKREEQINLQTESLD